MYIQRCKEVNPILNAIVESRFEAAISEARKVDEFLAWTTKTEGELECEMPLLGVPITVKESIAVQGKFEFLPFRPGIGNVLNKFFVFECKVCYYIVI